MSYHPLNRPQSKGVRPRRCKSETRRMRRVVESSNGVYKERSDASRIPIWRRNVWASCPARRMGGDRRDHPRRCRNLDRAVPAGRPRLYRGCQPAGSRDRPGRGQAEVPTGSSASMRSTNSSDRWPPTRRPNSGAGVELLATSFLNSGIQKGRSASSGSISAALRPGGRSTTSARPSMLSRTQGSGS